MYYDLPIDPEPFIAELVEQVDQEMQADVGDCPYLDRWAGKPGFEDATCGYGCREEPSCVTDEPADGWPSRRPGFDYRKAWAAEFAALLLANATVNIDLGIGRDT